MACGLPAVLTPNTGANDFVRSGINGEVVPIRDPDAIAEATLRWGERRLAGEMIDNSALRTRLSFDTFKVEFLDQLRTLGFLPHVHSQPAPS